MDGWIDSVLLFACVNHEPSPSLVQLVEYFSWKLSHPRGLNTNVLNEEFLQHQTALPDTSVAFQGAHWLHFPSSASNDGALALVLVNYSVPHFSSSFHLSLLGSLHSKGPDECLCLLKVKFNSEHCICQHNKNNLCTPPLTNEPKQRSDQPLCG